MADPQWFDPSRYAQPGIPNWYDPNLYAPDLNPQMPALAQAIGGGGSGTPSPVSSPGVPLGALQQSAVGATGNGAMGIPASGTAAATPQGALSQLAGESGAGGGNYDGYNGQSATFGDWLSAIAGGLGVVAGGLPGMVGMMMGATNGFKNGVGLVSNIKGLLGFDNGRGVLGSVLNSTAGGALGSKDLEVGSSLGATDFSGPDRGAQGDKTSEARGYRGGGAINAYFQRGGER